jgi:hypothetical protein
MAKKKAKKKSPFAAKRTPVIRKKDLANFLNEIKKNHGKIKLKIEAKINRINRIN